MASPYFFLQTKQETAHMKKELTILFLLIVQSLATMGQEPTVSQFLFDDYQEALILYKDGRQFTAPVNFDLLNGHYLFIDAKDKRPKQFANPEMIALIRIGSRSFLLEHNATTEVLQAEPLFQVTYSGNLRPAPKNLTYGGTTQTAAVDAYVGYSGSTVLGSQRQSMNKIVAGIDKRYGIKIGKKTKRFYNQSSFLKAFPKQQRAKVEEYLSKKDIDFNDVQQVFDLYKDVQQAVLNK